jgi:hypothetical protein
MEKMPEHVADVVIIPYTKRSQFVNNYSMYLFNFYSPFKCVSYALVNSFMIYIIVAHR